MAAQKEDHDDERADDEPREESGPHTAHADEAANADEATQEVEAHLVDDPEDVEGGPGPKVPIPVEPPPPSTLILLPVDEIVFFPGMVFPVLGTSERTRITLSQAMTQGRFVGVITERPEDDAEGPPPAAAPAGPVGDGDDTNGEVDDDDPLPLPDARALGPDDVFEIGCLGRLVQQVGGPGESGAIIQGIRRFRIKRFLRTEPVLIAQVEYPDDIVLNPTEVEALERVVRREVQELISLRPDIPDELGEAIAGQQGAARLVDFLSGHIGLPVDERQVLLETLEVDKRLRRIMSYFERELDLARIGKKVRSDIRKTVEKQQRDYYLREQLKALRAELGEEVDEKEIETETYEKQIADAKMPPEVEERARYELRRLAVLPQEAAEYHVIRTYLDWLVELPWSVASEDRLDIGKSARILDRDHHGLEEVKRRIVEFLAVRKLAPDQQGAILCLVGPPGVGKTSLGHSIARAMNREFYRVSLGGMRDEAEIKGHRRTYIGAMPGKIIQGIRRVGTHNPVFMLDEIDKLGQDWRGDPSSAMLEVLDPSQNDKFEDYYLDVPFDLSKVMFIATANYAGQIPKPLYDRMEVIEIPGYILAEKRAIASRYPVPRQLDAHGLTKDDLKFSYAALGEIVEGYTREAGVRELDRRIAQICRKVAADIVMTSEAAEEAEAAEAASTAARKKTAKKAPAARKKKKKTKKKARRKAISVGREEIGDFLGTRKFDRESDLRTRNPGVVTGLAWTPFGGDVLFIETRSMPGKGAVRITGQLGNVMSESVQIAQTLVRSDCARFHIDPATFSTRDLHIHVPAGAVPKDGPSAGVTMTTALVSLLCREGRGRKVSRKIAMTGEITLSGTVLPVGGIREKVVAAKRQGIKTVILPASNEPDLDDVPDRVKKGLEFVFAETIDDVLRVALPGLLPEA